MSKSMGFQKDKQTLSIDTRKQSRSAKIVRLIIIESESHQPSTTTTMKFLRFLSVSCLLVVVR